jgi:hypothetical protein
VQQGRLVIAPPSEKEHLWSGSFAVGIAGSYTPDVGADGFSAISAYVRVAVARKLRGNFLGLEAALVDHLTFKPFLPVHALGERSKPETNPYSRVTLEASVVPYYLPDLHGYYSFGIGYGWSFLPSNHPGTPRQLSLSAAMGLRWFPIRKAGIAGGLRFTFWDEVVDFEASLRGAVRANERAPFTAIFELGPFFSL